MSRSALLMVASGLAIVACHAKPQSQAKIDSSSPLPITSAPASPSAPITLPVIADGVPPDASAPELARGYFKMECARCHGPAGRGDGREYWAGWHRHRVAPRDFADPKWQASVSDEDIRSIMILGGEESGMYDGMPEHPLLTARYDLQEELVAIVRSFRANVDGGAKYDGPRVRLDDHCPKLVGSDLCLGVWHDQPLNKPKGRLPKNGRDK